MAVSMVRVVSFKCPEDLLEKVDMIAKASRASRSEVIREALEEYVSRHFRERVERISSRIGPRRLRIWA